MAFRRLIKKTFDRALSFAKISKKIEVTVIFVDDDEMKTINNEHRKINKTTDVLSFPISGFSNGRLIESDADYNPETGNLIIGDIIISLSKAIAQAEKYNHSVGREVSFLALHGLLHLTGYDHENESDEKKMFALQKEIIGGLYEL
jgi:probable rRNA maturation factor